MTPAHWKRNVALFLSGQTVSLFGSMLVQYAAMWYLTLETKSGVVLALSAVVGFGPQAIISLFGGVWADRHNRKYLIMAADGAIALSTLFLALLMLFGVGSIWPILVIMAIRSAGAGIQMPAVTALIPQITPTEKLMRVNGIYASIQSGMALVAPAVAGVLYATSPLSTILFIDVITAVIGIGLLLLVPVGKIIRSESELSYFADLKNGVQYVLGHPLIRWLVVLFTMVFILTVAPSYLTPLMMVRSFGDEVWKLTVLEVSFSIGMTLGGALIAAWGGLRNRVAMVVWSSVAFGALAISMGLVTNLWFFFALMFVVGLAVPMFSTPIWTLLQEKVEAEYQGRVFGFLGIAMAVGMPLGMVIFGPFADIISVETLLIIAGSLMIVVVALSMLAPSGKRAWKEGYSPADTGDGAAADNAGTTGGEKAAPESA